MVARHGALVTVKISTGGVPEVFSQLLGIQLHLVRLDRRVSEATHVAGQGWREIGPGGIRSMTLEGQGVFTHSAAEVSLFDAALLGEAKSFQISFGGDEILQGQFVVSSYVRRGDYDDVQAYSVRLESSGEIVNVGG